MSKNHRDDIFAPIKNSDGEVKVSRVLYVLTEFGDISSKIVRVLGQRVNVGTLASGAFEPKWPTSCPVSGGVIMGFFSCLGVFYFSVSLSDFFVYCFRVLGPIDPMLSDFPGGAVESPCIIFSRGLRAKLELGEF